MDMSFRGLGGVGGGDVGIDIRVGICVPVIESDISYFF